MTAEIGILNRYGVALAADSAVTISVDGKIKVLNSAEKLFCLTKSQPVGIMVFGNGSFMGVPWEIIIKQYRKNINSNCFDSLYDYCIDFFKMIKEDNRYFPEPSIEMYVYRIFRQYMYELLERVNIEIHNNFPNYEPPEDEVAKIIHKNLITTNNNLNKIPFSSNYNIDDIDLIKTKYKPIIINCLKAIINIKLSNEIIEEFLDLAGNAICRDTYRNESGVVIAGYGNNDIFPSLYQYSVEGILNGKIKYKLITQNQIYAEFSKGKPTASIVPFAQQEMVHSILTGVDPNLKNTVDSNLKEFFINLGEYIKEIKNKNNLDLNIDDSVVKLFDNIGDKTYAVIKDKIEKLIIEKYISPILNMVSSLPKNELASMAETLVNLTSFKRRITMDTETVGGPIDVAIISKTEGFIWIKRKYYFKADMNYHYFKNQ